MHKGLYQDIKTKRWFIKTTVTIDGTTRSVTIRQNKDGKSYTSKKEADEDYDRAMAQWITKHIVDANVPKWEKIVEEYSKYRQLLGIRISTIRSDEFIEKLYLTPYFKDLPVTRVFTLLKAKEWHTNILNDSSISAKRKAKIITRYKDILKYTYQNKYIDAATYQDCDVNTFQVKVQKTKATENDRTGWNEEEIQKFFSVIDKNTRDYVIYRLFFFLGCRIGEFQGLKVNCINFDKHYIEIRQQVIEGTGQGSWNLTTDLKTSDSYRNDYMTTEIENMLQDYIQATGLKQNDFLFYGDAPLSRNTLRRKLYYYCDLAKVKRIVPHELRHTQASILLARCSNVEEVKSIAKRLGHSMTTCINIYQNAREEKEKEILARLYN